MKNNLLKLPLSFFVLAGMNFSSCMHTVMMGSHGNHEGREAVSVTKEISSGGYTVAVALPPMKINNEEIIAITLKSKYGIPDRAAVHCMISKSKTESVSSGHNHGKKDDTEDFKPIHKMVPIIDGAASFPYKPVEAGRFILTIETTVDSTVLSTEVHFMVHENKGTGMMGMGADWDYPIVGVLAMSAMMITMWAIRGGF